MSWAKAFWEVAHFRAKFVRKEYLQSYWRDVRQDFLSVKSGGLVPDAKTLKALKKLESIG